MCWSDCDRSATNEWDRRSFASRAYRALAQDDKPRGAFETKKEARKPVILSAEGAKDLLLSKERQGHPVGPPEPVLRGILAAAGAPPQVHDVVLLRHLARRTIGPPVHGEPAIAGGIRQVRAPVAAHAFDREPLEWGPPVGRVPLLTRRDQRRHESAGLQEQPLELRGHLPTLLRRGEPEVQRRRGSDGGTIGHAHARAPADVRSEERRV